MRERERELSSAQCYMCIQGMSAKQVFSTEGIKSFDVAIAPYPNYALLYLGRTLEKRERIDENDRLGLLSAFSTAT